MPALGLVMPQLLEEGCVQIYVCFTILMWLLDNNSQNQIIIWYWQKWNNLIWLNILGGREVQISLRGLQEAKKIPKKLIVLWTHNKTAQVQHLMYNVKTILCIKLLISWTVQDTKASLANLKWCADQCCVKCDWPVKSVMWLTDSENYKVKSVIGQFYKL